MAWTSSGAAPHISGDVFSLFALCLRLQPQTATVKVRTALVELWHQLARRTVLCPPTPARWPLKACLTLTLQAIKNPFTVSE